MKKNMRTARRREFGARLRTARTAANLDLDELLARDNELTLSAIKRVEEGEPLISRQHLRVLIGLLHRPPAEREQLLELLDGDHDGCWTRPHPGREPESTPSVLYQHEQASAITCYDPIGLPVILQSSEYTDVDARARLGFTYTEKEVVALSNPRNKYSFLIGSKPHRDVLCYLHEAGLAALPVNPEVRAREVGYLARRVADREVRVRAVPASHDRAKITNTGFTLLRFHDYAPVVCVPGDTVTLILEGHHVPHYQRLLAELDKVALSEPDSANLVSDLANRLAKLAGEPEGRSA